MRTRFIRPVVYFVHMRTQQEVDRVLQLCRMGLRTSDIARRTGIPRSTVKDWRKSPPPPRQRDCEGHDFSRLEQHTYAYVLGMYLGDGCISPCPRGVWRLRITLDSAYPNIVDECVSAVGAVTPGKVNTLRRRGSRAVDVCSYWKHWVCVFPQHGPGRKHQRSIVLAEWQRHLVSLHPEPFLRGLIHSDGTRIIATERKGSYVRRAPRYAFSNRSEDILELFRAGCEATGVHCTRSSVKQISIYSKAAVARLDEFIGPKT